MQQVEAAEGNRGALVRGRDLAPGLQLRALLQRREGGLAGGIERHELAIENHALGALLRELRREARESGGELEALPRSKLHAVRIDEGEHPVAVELRLPHPARATEGGGARFGEHGRQLRGERLERT